ncbi:MAG: hypothetical protein V3U63_11135 [Gemmatimonadota bacterium]
MDCRSTASQRGPGRGGWPAALTLILLGALIMLGAMFLGAAANPTLASSEAAAPVIRIPADHPLPGPGSRVVVPVPAGGQIHFDPEAFDPASAQVSLEGADLVLRLNSGGELVLEGFFASVDPSAAIVLGETTISAEVLLLQIQALVDADSTPTLETAAGPTAGGGAELFGLLQVVSWLLDRLDLVSESQAAEPQQLAQSEDLARFAQLEAQLLIAREAEIVKLAAGYESVTAAILAELERWLASGRGSRADVEQARAFHLEAQLEVKEAEFRLTLAVDAHQDAYGERLETAAVPVWESAPPSDLAAITAELAVEQRALARGFWRRARHARETIKLLETLSAVAVNVRDAYRQQFEVAQRTLLDVEYAEKTLFQTHVRLVQRQVDLLVAEAWLLAALGRLSPDHIKHPGWQ